MRDELLNETLFLTLGQARDIVADWIEAYNTERPHSSLGYATPAAFAAELEKQWHTGSDHVTICITGRRRCARPINPERVRRARFDEMSSA